MLSVVEQQFVTRLAFLGSEFGLCVQDAVHENLGLLGEVMRLDYLRTDGSRALVVTIVPATKQRESRLSIMFCHGDKSFSLTDWLHAQTKIGPVFAEDDISLLKACLVGELADILRDKSYWKDVPMYWGDIK